VATNGCVRPTCTLAVAGVTAMEAKVALGTVTVAEPVLPPKVAVMRAVPLTMPVATPVLALTLATLVLPELQLEVAVTSWVEPSL